MIDDFLTAGYSRKTATVYATALRRAEDWLAERGHTLAEVPVLELATYADTLPWTRSSRALLRSSVGAYWKLVGRADNLAILRVPTHPRMRCRALDDIDAARLAATARARGDQKGVAVLFGLYAGLRRAEIARLRWSDMTDGWLTLVGKGDVTRSVPLHRVLVESLRPLRDTTGSEGPRGTDWIFVGRWGGPVNPTTVWLWTKEVSRSAGLPDVPTHVLRHTCLATALDNTKDLRAVQELAGHARPETTAGYTRVRRDRLVLAVSALAWVDS